MIKIDTNKTLYGALLDAAEQLPDKEILILGETRLTYRQLVEKVDTLATGLTKMGIVKGDKVGLILPNCVEDVYAFFAFSKIGVPFIPMNPLLRANEVKHILGDSQASSVITTDEFMGHNFLDMINEIRVDLPHLKHVIVYDETTSGVPDWRQSKSRKPNPPTTRSRLPTLSTQQSPPGNSGTISS